MVVQLVVGSEALTLRTTAYATSDKEFFAGHVLPDSLQSIKICLITSKGCHISYSAIKISCTNGMTNDLFLLEDRHVVLRILAGLMSVSAATCLLNEVFCTFEVFLVTCYLIKLAKSHLDDRMSARTMNLPLVRTKGLANEICILDSHIKEVSLTSSTIVSHCALYQMT